MTIGGRAIGTDVPMFVIAEIGLNHGGSLACALALVDAALHIVDLTLIAPSWKARARKSPPGSFWINLKPRCLEDRIYSIDADAVHLSRLKDIIWWFERKQAKIVARSDRMDIARAVLRHNCYVAIQKP